jgi:2-dehydropantoate 2-reductase
VKILVYGAGVLGSLYGARLQAAGQDVTLLARGQRRADLQQHGVMLENVVSGQRSTTRVKLVEELARGDAYDWVMVLMRKNQVRSILPILGAHRRTPNVAFLHNNAAGFREMIAFLGTNRVLLGFPGAGGTIEGPVVKYLLIPQQKTTLGELGGVRAQRLHELAQALRQAGFAVSVSRNMDAWLKTHVALVTAIAGALYAYGCDASRLARSPEGVPLMVQGVREGFRVLQALGLPVLPFKLWVLFEWLPRAVPVAYWRRYLASQMGEYALARHTRAAGDELKQLADEFRVLKLAAGQPTPALDQLYGYIDQCAARTGRG